MCPLKVEYGIQCDVCGSYIPQDVILEFKEKIRQQSLSNPSLWDGWISVKDRLPGDEMENRFVLIVIYGFSSCVLWKNKNFVLIKTEMPAGIADITHWAELPKRPNVEKPITEQPTAEKP